MILRMHFIWYSWKDRVLNKYEQSSSLGLYELVLFIDVLPILPSRRVTIDGDVQDVYFAMYLVVEVLPFPFVLLLLSHHRLLLPDLWHLLSQSLILFIHFLDHLQQVFNFEPCLRPITNFLSFLHLDYLLLQLTDVHVFLHEDGFLVLK